MRRVARRLLTLGVVDAPGAPSVAPERRGRLSDLVLELELAIDHRS